MPIADGLPKSDKQFPRLGRSLRELSSRIGEGTHGEPAARRGRTRPTFADFA